MAEHEDTAPEGVFELALRLRPLRLQAAELEMEVSLAPAARDKLRIERRRQDLLARRDALETLIASTPAATLKDVLVHVMLSYSYLDTIENSTKETCEDLFEKANRMLAGVLRVLVKETKADWLALDGSFYAEPSLTYELSVSEREKMVLEEFNSLPDEEQRELRVLIAERARIARKKLYGDPDET